MSVNVCMVCPYADRPQFARQILNCFRSQRYDMASLLIYDNGADPFPIDVDRSKESLFREPRGSKSIGMIRNAANFMVTADVIVHLDADDYSGPDRVSEQVALLEMVGRRAGVVVGYSDLLFWRPRLTVGVDHTSGSFSYEEGEAFLYRSTSPAQAPGSTLAYWRETWVQKPFPDLPRRDLMRGTGEDYQWLQGLSLTSVSSIGVNGEPRLVATIHPGNTSPAYRELDKNIVMGCPNWRRAPEFGEYCRRVTQCR